MLVLEKQDKFDGIQQFYAIVQLIGSRKQAESFAYRLVLVFHLIRSTGQVVFTLECMPLIGHALWIYEFDSGICVWFIMEFSLSKKFWLNWKKLMIFLDFSKFIEAYYTS